MSAPATLMQLSRAVSIEKAAARWPPDDPVRVAELTRAMAIRRRAGQHESVAEHTQAHVVAEAEREAD